MLSPTDPPAGLDWALLRSFVAVMRHGSLSAAAEWIGQTQPTIGRHIRALEQAVGEQLFTRRANAISPTGRAAALFERAAAMEAAALAVERLVAGGQEEVSGTVRLSVPEVLGIHLVPGLLARFQEKFPGVAIELVATNDTNDLSRREADIAVRFFRPTQPDLVMTKVGKVHVGLFAAPDYVARHGVPVGMQDFRGHRLIGDDETSRIISAMAGFGVAMKRSDFVYRTDSLLAQIAAAEAGIGIGAGLTMAFRGANVERLLPEAVNIAFDVHVVAHADLHRSRRIRALYDHLVEELRLALSRQ